MVVTIAAGFLLARWFNQKPRTGRSPRGHRRVWCSATLATSIVVPQYKGKEADVAFVVAAVNAPSTVAMVLYPLTAGALGFDEAGDRHHVGATIHDVAQVVGAGYAVSDPVANTAVIVELFRVSCCCRWCSRSAGTSRAARSPPTRRKFRSRRSRGFAPLCVLNSAALAPPAITPFFAPLKAPLVQASTWGLLIAIGALGLGTSSAGDRCARLAPRRDRDGHDGGDPGGRDRWD